MIFEYIEDDFKYKALLGSNPGYIVRKTRDHFGARYPEPHETIFPGWVDHTEVWMLFPENGDNEYSISFRNESDYAEFILKFG